MNFEWIGLEGVDKAVLNDFDSGSCAFNCFLQEYAEAWRDVGEAVTYLCVDREEASRNCVTRIYGYAAINTNGLLYTDNSKKKYLQCAEIRMFAIAKQLRGHKDPTCNFSRDIFYSFLQNMYIMSMTVIGFKAIFLNSNHEGYHLYKECGFDEITDYIPPEDDDKIEIDDCTPLLLVMNEDAIYDFYS